MNSVCWILNSFVSQFYTGRLTGFQILYLLFMNYLLCSVLGFRILDWALLLSAYCAYPSTRILKRMNKTGQFRATEQGIGFQRTIFLRSGFFEGRVCCSSNSCATNNIKLNKNIVLKDKTDRTCFYTKVFLWDFIVPYLEIFYL